MNSDLLQAVQRGWKIFPLVHSSRFAVRQPLLHHATSNDAQIEHWENENPECNWAVTTGKESQVFALKFSLDTGIETMREFCEHHPGISHTLQMRGPNELLAFLEWPADGLPTYAGAMIAQGARLRGEQDYVPIPGPGLSVNPRYEYVDREAPVLPASECLMDLIRMRGSGQRTPELLAFNPLPIAAQCVLLSFAKQGDRWFCDFYESSGTAKIRETLTYRCSETVVSLAMRGGAIMDSDNRSRLYGGLQVGHGSILLNLTAEQYNKLIAA